MLKRLPIIDAPATGETVKSYLQRLSALNAVAYPELWTWVSVPRVPGRSSRVVVGGRMAELTDRPLTDLARALPELSAATDWTALRDNPQHGCPRCTTRRLGGTVMRLFAHHDYVCRKHGYWIGPPDICQGPDLPALARTPDVLAAQRRHHQLARQHGPLAAFDAIVHGFRICTVVWNRGRTEDFGTRIWRDWDERLDRVIPVFGARSVELFSHSRCHIPIYPEAVAVAELIAVPAWQALTVYPPGSPHRQRWETELADRLGITGSARFSNDLPLLSWAGDRAAERIRPAHTYVGKNLNTFDGTRAPSRRSQRSHQRSADFFAKHRNAADTFLYFDYDDEPDDRPVRQQGTSAVSQARAM